MNIDMSSLGLAAGGEGDEDVVCGRACQHEQAVYIHLVILVAFKLDSVLNQCVAIIFILFLLVLQ
jgi:hypothetical protein